MKNLVIQLKFKQLSPANLSVFAKTILLAMTGNANFPNPYPVLNLLQAAILALSTAVDAQVKGVKATTQAVKKAQRDLNRLLTALAAYVVYESDTDEVMALSSGFSLQGPSVPQSNTFTATQGVLSGTVDLNSPGIAGGGAFIYGHTADPLSTPNWIVDATTVYASYTVTGLTPGTKYWFHVALVTSLGQQSFGDPVMVHVV
jgi:hypothetical protein